MCISLFLQQIKGHKIYKLWYFNKLKNKQMSEKKTNVQL